jgi:AraC-like DNA-binding protein
MRVVLNESDLYREFAPPAWARAAIACFWVRRGDGSSVRVLPDACADIVWRRGAGAVIAGPDSEAWTSRTLPGELIVGARLRPGAGGAAFGVPLTELRNARVPVDALGVDPRGELSAALDPGAAPAAVAAVALARVAQAPPDPAVQAAVVRLLDPMQRVDELAMALGFSERQLRRRFLAAVGYGPKLLQRVLRLRRFLAAAGSHASFDGLAASAVAAGYADQAHLARECRALAGLTPGQLVRPRLRR